MCLYGPTPHPSQECPKKMNSLQKLSSAALLLATLAAPGLAAANLTIPSDGSDGALVVGDYQTLEIDLSQALTGAYTTTIPAGSTGKGIYDPAQWAVVYKYSSVDISTFGNVVFKNHPSGAPVIWLVSGDVKIRGAVNVSAANPNGGEMGGNGASVGGPGGFNGGTISTQLARIQDGSGPGGASLDRDTSAGNAKGSSGGYATAGNDGGSHAGTGGITYGNEEIMPLIGGSGGSASLMNTAVSGGGGGGAIMIVSATKVEHSGAIYAHGGTPWLAGAGSGGAIKIVAETITGGGALYAQARGADVALGGEGRIRLEAITNTLSGVIDPPASLATTSTTPKLFPDALTPRIVSTKLSTENVPADPRPLSIYPTDVLLDTPATYTLEIACEQVPVPPASASVVARIVPAQGASTKVNATYVSGNLGSSLWTAQIPVPAGRSTITARAEF